MSEGPNPSPPRSVTLKELYWSGLLSGGEYNRRRKEANMKSAAQLLEETKELRGAT